MAWFWIMVLIATGMVFAGPDSSELYLYSISGFIIIGGWREWQESTP